MYDATKTEIELKYLVRCGMASKRARKKMSRKLKNFGFTVKRSDNQRIEDIYFDTQDHTLEQQGWSLRLRSTDARQIVTLKSVATADASFKRTEIEHEFDSSFSKDTCTINIRPESRISRLLQSLNIQYITLLPVYQQNTLRRRYQLTHASHKPTCIEWAVDTVRNSGSINDYVEFEFELLEGQEPLLDHITLIAQSENYLRPSRMSKLQRGLYAQYPHKQPALRRAEAALAGEKSWRSHGLDILEACRDSLHRCEPFAFEALHPEGVHQLRVATRRTRAALNLFRDVVPAEQAMATKPAFKRLSSALGEMRDLDVHQAQLARKLNRSKWHPYRRYLHKQISKQQQCLQQVITQDFDNLHRQLVIICRQIATNDNTGGQTVAQHVDQVLPATINRILQAGAKLDREASADELHAFRIILKQLRYQLEIFAGMNGDIDRLTHAARNLQTLLGDHQDTQLARAMIQKFISRYPEQKFPALEKFSHKQTNKAEKYREMLQQVWKQFEQDCKPLQVIPQSAKGFSQ
ncbi:MAG: CHAD domain-containing protein [bacterium]